MEAFPLVDIVALAREIAVQMAPDALLNREDLAVMLRCATKSLDRYVNSSGFPRPIRLQGSDGTRSNRRWLRADVVAWIKSHETVEQKRVGRPRNTSLHR